MEPIWGEHLNRRRSSVQSQPAVVGADNERISAATSGGGPAAITKCSAVLQQLVVKLRSKLAEEDMLMKLSDKETIKELRRGKWQIDEIQLDAATQQRAADQEVVPPSANSTDDSGVSSATPVTSGVVEPAVRGPAAGRKRNDSRSQTTSKQAVSVEQNIDAAKVNSAPANDEQSTEVVGKSSRPRRRRNLNENFVRINKKCKRHVRYRPYGQLGKGGYSKWKRKQFWKIRRQARYEEYAKAKADDLALAMGDQNKNENQSNKENEGGDAVDDDALEPQECFESVGKLVANFAGQKRRRSKNSSIAPARSRSKRARTGTAESAPSTSTAPASSTAAKTGRRSTKKVSSAQTCSTTPTTRTTRSSSRRSAAALQSQSLSQDSLQMEAEQDAAHSTDDSPLVVRTRRSVARATRQADVPTLSDNASSL